MDRFVPLLLSVVLMGAANATEPLGKLHAAIERNDVQRVRILLAQNTSPNLRKDTRASPTFLTQAARLGREEIISVLLVSGADINGIDGDAMTPLMHASRNGHLRVVELLLNAGAQVNEQMKWGDSALSLAQKANHGEVVAVLIRAGAK